jgi:hypothetical protein
MLWIRGGRGEEMAREARRFDSLRPLRNLCIHCVKPFFFVLFVALW